MTVAVWLRAQCSTAHLTRMETVSTLVNNVSNLVLVSQNASNFTGHPFNSDGNRTGRASGLMTAAGNEANLMEFNAALMMADFRHVQQTLFALQRNLDDFYFVVLTAITFGIYLFSGLLER